MKDTWAHAQVVLLIWRCARRAADELDAEALLLMRRAEMLRRWSA